MNLKTSLLALLIVFNFSCAKTDVDLLEGKWQLKITEYPGGCTAYNNIFYNYFHGVMYLQAVSENAPLDQRYGQYSLTKSSLDIKLTDRDYNEAELNLIFKYYGWTENVKKFTITKINKREMVMECSDTIYQFHKY